MAAGFAADSAGHLLRGAAVTLDARIPGRPHRRQVGPAPLRDEAGEPGQQAQVHHHRRRHRACRGLGERRRSASWATTSRRSASTTRRGAPTASPRRAASTPPRTIATTATASSGCSTTPSRAATTAPARPTSIASPRLSVQIIDQAVAQGVPFAREYGGVLDNRSFGGAQVSRTFYARGQTGQQLLLGAYQSLMRQVEAGSGRRSSPTARCSISSSSTARRAASSSATC